MISKEERKGRPGKPSAKRVEPPLRSDYNNRFLKDWARIKDAGRQDMARAKEGMKALLANEGPLPPEYKDHPLAGKWTNHREFHAGGDLLVVYYRDGDMLVFARIGTHTDLFD